jgi:hypothetical protein
MKKVLEEIGVWVMVIVLTLWGLALESLDWLVGDYKHISLSKKGYIRTH